MDYIKCSYRKYEFLQKIFNTMVIIYWNIDNINNPFLRYLFTEIFCLLVPQRFHPLSSYHPYYCIIDKTNFYKIASDINIIQFISNNIEKLNEYITFRDIEGILIGFVLTFDNPYYLIQDSLGNTHWIYWCTPMQ